MSKAQWTQDVPDFAVAVVDSVVKALNAQGTGKEHWLERFSAVMGEMAKDESLSDAEYVEVLETMEAWAGSEAEMFVEELEQAA
jgi:hypothetical protein